MKNKLSTTLQFFVTNNLNFIKHYVTCCDYSIKIIVVEMNIATLFLHNHTIMGRKDINTIANKMPIITSSA